MGDHGINCFINRQLIYNYPEEIFAKRGVMAIEHSDFEGTERLAAVLGADITSTFDNPEEVQLGFCEKIEEIMIGEDKVIKFSDVPRARRVPSFYAVPPATFLTRPSALSTTPS